MKLSLRRVLRFLRVFSRASSRKIRTQIRRANLINESRADLVMIEEKVKNFLKQKNFSLKGKRILVGVSGGPDSLALLNFLWEEQQLHRDFYMVVAHVDHMFRGVESLNEAKFVESFCAGKDIP